MSDFNTYPECLGGGTIETPHKWTQDEMDARYREMLKIQEDLSMSAYEREQSIKAIMGNTLLYKSSSNAIDLCADIEDCMAEIMQKSYESQEPFEIDFYEKERLVSHAQKLFDIIKALPCKD